MTYGTTRTAVVAIGGNALAPSGAESSAAAQFHHTRQSLVQIVEMALDGWGICVVHGNGPQVGDELLRNDMAAAVAAPLPLGVLVASTAGWIGYMIQQSLENALARAHSDRTVATVITQVVVDPGDPALHAPTKFIGHALSGAQAQRLVADGQQVRADGHGRLRRVVPSPKPQAIQELATIRRLLARGTIVVCCGGGGVPVHRHPELGWEGVDAVVDKDLAAGVLARDLGAELLLILTDVEGVYEGWGTPTRRLLPRLGLAEAERLDSEGTFGAGSMAPKVRASIDFVRRTGGRAIIAELSRGCEAVRGEAGTTITVESA
ncbi:MAG TPA: carbamate kinase [Gemmatimonadales bacterium]